MEFGIEKCAVLITRSGKRHITETIELSNQEKIRTPGEKKLINTWEYRKRTLSKEGEKNDSRNLINGTNA